MSERIGIIVSGGPAPGINSVISSVTLAAHHYGYKTCGLNGGFLGIQNEGTDAIMDLHIADISRAYKAGGSILGTSRFNPFNEAASKKKFEDTIKAGKLNKLIIIGGEGSAYLSHLIATEYKHLQVVHVPKTIDNDLSEIVDLTSELNYDKIDKYVYGLFGFDNFEIEEIENSVQQLLNSIS